MSTSMQAVQDPVLMSRRELQAALRALKLRSGGTNDELRQRLLSAQTSAPATANVPATVPAPVASPAEAKAPVKDEQEKRQRRFRDSCPVATRQRIERARNQTMYLVTKDENPDMQALSCNFVVLGSTGNVYKVAIQRVPRCTCPDHARGNLCKHILFVLLKVMRIPPDSPLIYQTALIGSELEEMFEGMRNRFQQVSGSVLACKEVQESYAKLGNGEEVPSKVARRTDDEDCPICFDPLGPASATTFCRSQCGANFHNACISHWLKQQHGDPTCPMCRGSWEKPASSTSSQYTNLGHLQGQSPDRDMSTYYSGSYNRKRRRYYD